MNEREKLNAIWLAAIFVAAAIVGTLFQSWIVFFVALIVLSILAAVQGGLRGSNGPYL